MPMETKAINIKEKEAKITVNLQAIEENWNYLTNLLAKETICSAVVKSDAYGLGAEIIAPLLAQNGCNVFFVAKLEEGIKLRDILGEKPQIIIMHGPNTPVEIEYYHHNLIPVLNSPNQIKIWREFIKPKESKVRSIIHVDTGMNRLGLSQSQINDLLDDSDQLKELNLFAIMSHLACAGDPNHKMNLLQNKNFLSIVKSFRKSNPQLKASLANSAGIFLGNKWHYDIVRPGAAIYGLNPFSSKKNPMQTVLNLKAKIIQLRNVDTIQTVGYGSEFNAPLGSRLAVVSLGYADGFFRSVFKSGKAFFNGNAISIAGRISMDLMTLDISNIPESTIAEGDWIELISPEHTVEDLAIESKTISYEILTSIAPKLAKEYIT